MELAIARECWYLLIKGDLDFSLQKVMTDPEGRYIMLDAVIQDSRYCLLNIYAPNKSREQIQFFRNISEEIKAFTEECNSSIIVGGVFNVILDEALNGRGGNKRRKESAKLVEEMCVEHDLIDIWRIRNPTETRFTWRQKKKQLYKGVWITGLSAIVYKSTLTTWIL